MSIFMIFAFISCDDQPVKAPEETVLFAGGNGSLESPFEIETADQFARIGLADPFYYILNNDITIPADTFIENFNGKLDGNGKTLSYSGSLKDTYCLIWGLMDGAELKNLNVNLGNYEKTLVGATAGKVVFDNVNISGNIIPSGNNVGGYLIYVGYCDYDTNAERQPADVVFKNCTNKVNISDMTGTKWGFGPFLAGMAMPDVAKESTLTYENCVNEGKIYGGHVGWVAGNQSLIGDLKKITVRNCKNANGGYVKGYVKAGDVSWGAQEYTNADLDETFKNMVELANGEKVTGSLEKATRKVVLTTIPENTSKIALTGTFFLQGFADSKLTTTNVHMTHYLELANIEGNKNEITLDSIIGIDSKFSGDGIEESIKNAKTGEILTGTSGAKYVYLGELLLGNSSTTHTCLNPKTHTAEVNTLFATCYDANGEIISTAQLIIK